MIQNATSAPSRLIEARRLYAVLGGLYLAQGIPTYLLIVALPPLLRESGASRTSIGLFSLLMLPLVLKFAWAPLIDRYPLVRRLGHRRGWIVPTQICVAVLIAVMALLSPSRTGLLFACALGITLLSSTQDIATDGFAVKGLDHRTRATGNAIQAGSVALGVIVGGTLSLVLFEHLGWRPALLTVAVMSLLPLAVVPWMNERPTPRAARPDEHTKSPSLATFFRRPGAWTVFLFAVSYRASEGLVRGMEGAYLVDVGLPLSWIGYLQGSAAAGAGLLGAAAAAFLIRRSGLAPTLVLLGGLRTLCFLAFSLSALHILPGFEAAMAASAFQTFIRYMELVAIYSLFMRASGTEQPGTDFTILTCAELVVYLVGSSLAGLVADRFGYPALFLSAAILSGLGIALAAVMLKRLDLSGPAGARLSADHRGSAPKTT